MPKPKRNVQATAEESFNPPAELSKDQTVARVVKGVGNSLYLVELPPGDSILAELPSRFRKTVWIRNGGYVLINTGALEGRDNKLGGEITNIVLDEKNWRKLPYWPKEFVKRASLPESDEEDSVVGQMPPSDSDSGST